MHARTCGSIVATAILGGALLVQAASASAESHTEMPTLSAQFDGGLCATTLNAKINIFDDSDQVALGYQTADIAGTGSAGCGSSLVAVVNWRNVDSGGVGSVSRRMFHNETNSISFAPGPGRIATELTTLGAHVPDASRAEVVMHG
ncbi:hypothetical protein ACFYTQ_06285 [Nocardia sp. NPDC004068]|uniref:hypothetical protein n=1 Tax=Nocardia sp. NPDC004068 TaxID=3364303 RepID=UPI0036D0BFE6